MDEIISKMEKRSFPLKVESVSWETRAVNGQNTEVLRGKAAVFGEFSEMTDRWGDKYQEQLAQDCMDETLADGHKIMALYNHDWTGLMGSTADNLTLEKKDDGLYFELVPKNHEFDRRIVDFIRSGTIGGCSVGFRIASKSDGTYAQLWEYKDDTWYRIIQKIILYEISFTPIPAYEQTNVDVEVRKLTAEKENSINTQPEDEERKQIMAETEELLRNLSK